MNLDLEKDNPGDENVQDIIEQLKSLVEDVIKSKEEVDENHMLKKEKEGYFKTDLISIEDINDEHLKLEV